MTPITFPNAPSLAARAINDSGTVLLQADTGDIYLYQAGTFTLIPVPSDYSSFDVSVTALNNKAEFIGVASLTDGTTTAFIARPASQLSNGKSLGECNCPVGDPINPGTGNKFETVTDYATAGPNKLVATRDYNSLAGSVSTFATMLGNNWRSNFDRYIRINSPSSVTVERADGQQLDFSLNGSAWTSDTDVDIKLTVSGTSWTLTDTDDTVESYTGISSGEAVLSSIRARNGYAQRLTYNGLNQLASVMDSYGRSLSFTYNNGLLQTLTTPDNLTLTYGYSQAGGGNVLTSVAYSTSPATQITYLYENTSYPFALTGIIDENGNRYATWTYDSSGRALSSEHAGEADLTAVTYNDSDGSRIVTNALSQQDTYRFSTLQSILKVTEIDRAATSTTAAATRLFTYDSNGYVATATDWNGNSTQYTNDVHGQPTTIVEAYGTSAARTTTVTYDANFHLPDEIVTPGLTTDFTYDDHGEQLTKTLTDTTNVTAPYATAGQTRTWTNTWSNFLLASAQTPNGNKTLFGYDSSGALTSITDPLSHVTQITAHTGGGLPLTVIDPNNVTTTLTYDARQRRTSSTVSGATGSFKTSWAFDAAGNLTQTTLPDNSFLANTYDAAHRLTKVTDADGNSISYTLNALGDRTQTSIANSGGTVTWQSYGSFDAFGRELVDTAGAGQTTARTYDPNGNVLTVTDGLDHTTTNTYDALNRLTASTDANGGQTATAYDTHDRVTSVTDANANQTAYVRDGFGDVIQQSSPDSGVTLFQYDGDANLTSKTDALGIVTNQTFDALDRPLTTAYPSDASQNVAYSYDQAGSGSSFGVGRLTGVTDAAGSLIRAYDELGNLASEQRATGNATPTTAYTYDPASRVASLTYPDGLIVNYQHDAAGYLTRVAATPSGAATATTIATITHQPFGPMNGTAFGNGISETRAFDASYHPTGVIDALAGTNLQNLAYAYDNANNVTSITDAVNAANTQAFGYDPINRLTSAASDAGGYGSYAWTYDKVGNRLTQVANATTTTYGYQSGTNRLATISTATATASLRRPAARTVKIHAPQGTIARLIPATTQMLHAPQPPPVARQKTQKSALATILGWPLLLIGFGGIVSFRKRLAGNPLLVFLMVSLLLGRGAMLLIGCGTASSGTAASPATPSTPAPTPIAATPTFAPVAGNYSAPQTVTISDPTPGSTIYFTLDGTTPGTGSTKYTGPLSVASSETVQAMAVASGYADSAVGSAAYTINLPVTATPTFSPAPGTYTSAQTVTILDATSGAAIYFTTDGTTPTTSSTPYSGALTVSSTETIQAIAVAGGGTPSAVATSAYTISNSATVSVITNANGNITSIPPENSTTSATFSYNAANRLSGVTGTPLVAASYVYDYAGQRISKTTSSSTPILYSYALDGSLIAEKNGGTLTDYIYADGKPIAVLQPGATPAANQVNYVLTDHLGTLQKVVNTSGATVWSTTYTPFGEGGAPASAVVQSLRLPGQSYDLETGFHQNGFRDYMPNHSRYLETDPIGLGGGTNTYSYAGANPLATVDPSGLAETLVGQPVGPYNEPYVPFSSLPPSSRALLQYREIFQDANGNLQVGFHFPDSVIPTPTFALRGPDEGNLMVGFQAVPPEGTAGCGGQAPQSGIRVGFKNAQTGLPYFKAYNASGQMISPVTGRTVDNNFSHYPIDLPSTVLSKLGILP